MKIAVLLDNNSIFNNSEFIKVIKQISIEEKVKIDLLFNLRKCNYYDLVFSFSKKLKEKLDKKIYKYIMFYDSEIQSYINGSLADDDLYEYNELVKKQEEKIKEEIRKFKEENKQYVEGDYILKGLEEDTSKDFQSFDGEIPVIVSAPHNVSQYYNGTYKKSDYGTGRLAFNVIKNCNCYGIIKTRNVGNVLKNDNVNMQKKSLYKDEIKRIVKENKVKAIIDIHSLNRKREEDINLGLNGGINLFNDYKCIKEISNIINKYGYNISFDFPFKGGNNTISGYANNCLGIHSIQIEINSKYINYNYKTSKYNELVKMISELVIYLNGYIKK